MNKERVQRKEITAATPLNYVKTIKLFCEMNDILLPWKGITSGLPKARRYADDRAPTIEEVRKIIEYPDRRIKAIVLTMVSSGIRLGAWDYLKWKHIIPIEREGKITAAKIVVYKGDPEEYISFTTPENQKAPIPHTILSISITDRIHKESRFIKRGLCEAVNFRERQSLEKWDWGKFV
jgi:integrase